LPQLSIANSFTYNSPLLYDNKTFSFVALNGILLELDAESGELRSSIPTPPNPDDMAFDPATERVFVPGSGQLSVYDVSAPGQIKPLQQVQTGDEARTGILFASGTRYAVAVPAFGNSSARVLIFDINR
jgi:DNA-binding beta-propeller fold protein YncE